MKKAAGDHHGLRLGVSPDAQLEADGRRGSSPEGLAKRSSSTTAVVHAGEVRVHRVEVAVVKGKQKIAGGIGVRWRDIQRQGQ